VQRIILLGRAVGGDGPLTQQELLTADLEAARLLQVPLNSPVAEVRRVFTTADRTVIYLGEVTYRGDFIRIDMDLRP